MKIASPKLNTSNLSANDEALLRCKTALEQKDRGDYAGAQKTMRPYWSRIGEAPNTRGLDRSVAAEVLLCVGILTGWIGSKSQVSDAQETAKNLITQSIGDFDAVRDVIKVAIAQSEIAYCYWREGALNEARSWLHDALENLTFEGAARARALLKLSTVEWTSGRFREALELLNQNESLFRKITNPKIKGNYHTELAIIHRNLATTENRHEYFRRAIFEYKEAEKQFTLAGNQIFRADVINNVGFLLFKLGRYKEAHKYLDEARRLTGRFKNKAHTAQVDESRAQVLVAEGRLAEAERVACRAVSVLKKSGHFCMMAEALITQGVALARMGRSEYAHFIFRQAIEAAHQVNALNTAGLAALTLIEEVQDLAPEIVQAAYRQAREWLAHSQSPDTKLRLADVTDKVVASIQTELKADDATEILLTGPGGLQAQLDKYEGVIIKRALAQVGGKVTHAASLLELRYQSLAYKIEHQHPELLNYRTPVRRRQRKDRSKPTQQKP
ncbi:MAG TPA: tetratricopeptide repeat protein [Pyrinomonadaceae bacterium]|nr:tetratricopeptide repeat protein [Pyrinomonadaceae bacterium]